MIELLNRILDSIEKYLMMLLMFAATIVTIVQVAARYVFNNSLYWSEEFILYALITMSFLAASMGVRYSAHISVEAIYAFVGPRVARLLKVFSAILGLVFAGSIIYYGGRLFRILDLVEQRHLLADPDDVDAAGKLDNLHGAVLAQRKSPERPKGPVRRAPCPAPGGQPANNQYNKRNDDGHGHDNPYEVGQQIARIRMLERFLVAGAGRRDGNRNEPGSHARHEGCGGQSPLARLCKHLIPASS